MEQVLCDPTTGQWVTGEITQIKCLNVCTEFGGSKTDFTLHQDVLVFCNEQPDGTNRCDLFCPGDEIQPVIQETNQTISTVVCDWTNDDGWSKLSFDMFGNPAQEVIQGDGPRNVICNEVIPDPDKHCQNVKESYSIDTTVIVKVPT